MHVLHHLNAPPPPPPHLGKRVYPLSRVLVTIANYKKHGVALFRAFSGNLPETLAKKYPISRENGKTLVQVLINFKRKSKHFQTEKWKIVVNRGGGGEAILRYLDRGTCFYIFQQKLNQNFIYQIIMWKKVRRWHLNTHIDCSKIFVETYKSSYLPYFYTI